MPKYDGVPSTYPCLMQKDHLRRVDHPHDERVVVSESLVRRAFAKVVAVVHAERSIRGDS
jgi:hypothetical protein